MQLNTNDFIGKYEDRGYFSWDKFVPMVLMSTQNVDEIRELMLEGLQVHLQIQRDNQEDIPTVTPEEEKA